MIVTFESTSGNENWSPRGLAALIAKRQSSGDDAKYLIAPTQIESNSDDTSNQSCTAARSSQPRKTKNHLRANRQALKEKQRNNKDAALERQTKEKLKLQKLEEKKKRLYGKVRSKAFRPAAPPLSLPNPAPSSAEAPHISSSSRASPLLEESTSKENEFHIAFGRKVSISAPLQGSDTSVASSGSRHKCYGKVPSYITDRKAKIEQDEEKQRRMRENAPPAPGLVLLEESERLRTISLLEENDREAREALQNIPFSMNEQKAARMRDAIQFRLKEIDDTRKIFSKDKVFVSRQNDD
mmetsp:Transcript_1064/g.2344  ORF Transcript_1064/g.2344 Transcript_1064/m.2344 type:complete len:297 (+) Transcript_1064:2612-3502(+)